MNKEKIEELVEKLNNATKLYDEGRPPMSDEEWDYLYFTLDRVEKETGIILPDSPTQKINYQVVNELKKVKHIKPMLSLAKTKDVDTVESFIKNKDWVAMAKMDGLTTRLTYENGELVRAETRGNGEVGEDITHNAKVIPSIPNKINCNGELIIDGEVICTDIDFKPFSKEYKNSRNFARGSLRLLDSKECEKRCLTFVAWDVIKGFEEKTTLHSKLWQLYESYNFKIVPYEASLENVEQAISNIKDISNELGYPIDGVVFKYNNCNEYGAAGGTAHHPAGALSYKFYDEEYETTLLDIEWTMGRTGKLSPVAIFKEVDDGESIIQRANLHNVSVLLNTLNCTGFSGQKIKIAKMNMIIPQVVWAETCPDMATDITFNIPKTCPICGQPTEIIQENDSKVLYCGNPSCEGKTVNYLNHFCGTKGLDIKGLSKTTLTKLIDWGWVSDIEDIFELGLHRDEWIKKPGFGQASVDKILTSIQNSCCTNFESWISALGIPLVGKAVAKTIKPYCNNYHDFYNKVIDKNFHFYDIDGIGLEIDNAIKHYDYTLANVCYNRYIIEENDDVVKNDSLKGLTFVITGKLKEFKNRNELKEVIEAAGGKVSSSVSKKTSYLINNDTLSKTTKNETAKKLSVPIISEQEFKEKFDF